MDVAQLIDIALADVDRRRVDIATLEPAEFSIEAVGGLAAVLMELTDAVVSPEKNVRVTGSWEHDTYLISIFAGDVMAVLKGMLEDSRLALGISSVARLAARHHVSVRFAPDPTGTVVRLTVPADLVRRTAQANAPVLAEDPETAFVPHELERRVLVPAGSVRDETEAFLESVFGVLRSPWREPDRPEPAVLQVRVPGESYSVTDDDSPSTAAAEAAVDIRSALSTFDRGRRSAGVAG